MGEMVFFVGQRYLNCLRDRKHMILYDKSHTLWMHSALNVAALNK